MDLERALAIAALEGYIRIFVDEGVRRDVYNVVIGDRPIRTQEQPTVIYELRVYEAIPGKLPALHARFTSGTLRLFAKHGIEQVGFWTTYVGPSTNTLTYLLRWDDLGERQRRWDAFSSDPDWLAVRTESERDGPLVARVQSIFLKPTQYSALQ